MTPKARRIFVATALGTMLGLYASIAFLPDIVWWFGALIGGISAGLIYGLPEIIRYSPTAFQIAKNDLQKTGKILPALFGIPTSKKWRFLMIATFFALVLTWMSGSLVIGLKNDASWMLIILMTGLLYIIPAEIIMMWGFNPFSIDHLNGEKSETEQINRAKKAIFLMLPVGMLYLLILTTVRIGPILIKAFARFASEIFAAIAESSRFLATFFKALFFFVHSKELVLCSIDSATAVLISYSLTMSENLQTGPALLLGGLMGGLLGILHYEIISVRVLRVSR